MYKKMLTVLSLAMILTLSGCVQLTQKIWHNQDNSGKYVIEMILSEDMLSIIGFGGTAEEIREELLQEFAVTPEELKSDFPNLKDVSVNSYYDAEDRAFHVVMEIDLFDMTKGFQFDENTDMDSLTFTITDNNDGTFRFSQTMDYGSAVGNEIDQEYLRMFEPYLAQAKHRLELHVEQFIEADPIAIYDRSNKVIVWEIPLTDLMKLTEPIEFWAVYRTKSRSLLPGLDLGEGFNWVPYAVGGLCCLTLIAVIVIVIVIVVLARKKKAKQVQPTIIEPGSNFD